MSLKYEAIFMNLLFFGRVFLIVFLQCHCLLNTLLCVTACLTHFFVMIFIEDFLLALNRRKYKMEEI
jgi:hypothetical protein